MLRIDDLSNQIKAEGFELPRKNLSSDAWTLEPPGMMALMEKMRRVGQLLKEFIGCAPVYGIKTGFNEAYLIDSLTRNRLVEVDPSSETLFRPFLRGQDVDRWYSQWAGQWMIRMKSSSNYEWPWSRAGEQAEDVFMRTYPALHEHFCRYRRELAERRNKAQFWWELSGNSHWELFDQPKIIYPDLTWRPSFSLEKTGATVGDTIFFLPVSDLWILAVLNSPIMWSWLWRNTVHGKDEVLRLKTIYTEQIPIPPASDAIRSAAESAVRKLIDLTARQKDSVSAVLDWLRVEYAADKPSQKLQDVSALAPDALVDEVKKVRGKKNPLTVAGLKALREEHGRSIVPLQTLALEARTLERQVAELVNTAYGLTPEEVALMWKTAPPRMPGIPPTT
jgi:hypothetical protein